MTATAQDFNSNATPPAFPPAVVTQFLRHARDGHGQEVKEMLEQHGKALAHVRDENGKGAFSHAAETGRKNLFPLLKLAGGDIDEKDNEGRTPLMTACRRGYANMAIALINFGANKEATDNDKWTPVMHAAFREAPKADDNGKPAPIVMPKGKMLTLSYLLKDGVKLDVVDRSGQTVEKQVERAQNKDALDVIKFEIAKRAATKADFERRLRQAIDGFSKGYEADLTAPPRAVFKKRFPSPNGPLD